MRGLLSSLVIGASLAALAAPVMAQTAIRSGQTISGSLQRSDSALGDQSLYDCYRLQTTAGRPMTVTLRSEDFDAYLAIVAGADCSSSAVPESDDDSGGGTDALITFTPGNGIYSIRANSLGRGQTGAYSLAVAAGVPASSGSVGVSDVAFLNAAGDIVSGSLAEGDRLSDDESFYDCYAFDARAGQTVSIGMGSEDFDTFLSLHEGSDCDSEVDSNDDGFEDGGTDSFLEYRVVRAGRYTIRANSLSGGETGNYELILEVM